MIPQSRSLGRWLARLVWGSLLVLAVGVVPAATVSWVGPTTGAHDWSAPSNWEGGRVPGPTDDARVVGDSTNLVVRVLGNFSVRSVESTALLRITSDVTVNSVLTVSGTFLNRGTLQIASERSDRTSTLILTGVGGLENRGLIWIRALNEGGRRINGGISNRGRILVEDGIQLSVGNAGTTFGILDGRVDAPGGLAIQGGLLTILGGTITGDVRLFSGTVDVAASLNIPATVRLLGACTLVRNASTASTLRLDTDVGNNTSLTASNGAVNVGRLVLASSRSDRNARLELGARMTNAPSGVIEARADGGGDRSINGLLVNQGVLGAPDTTLLFTGTYQSDGGRVTGDVRFLGARVVSSRAPTEGTTLALYGATSYASSEIPAALQLRVISDVAANARLGFETNLIHSGTILLESLRSDRATVLQVEPFHFVNQGLIRIVSTNGGERRFEGRLTQRGLLTVDAGIHLTLATQNRQLALESGAVDIQGSMSVEAGRFVLAGGNLSGDLRVFDASVFVASSMNRDASFRVLGGSTVFEGLRSPRVTLMLDTDVLHNTVVRAQPGAVNEGRLVLSSSRSDRVAQLEFGSAFTNAPSGVIESEAGAGGDRRLNGVLTDAGRLVSTGITTIFTGTYRMNGSRVAGDVEFRNAIIEPLASPSVAVELRLFGGGSVLAADNLPNVVLRIISDIAANARLAFNTNLVNRGVIRLESLRSDRDTGLLGAAGVVNAEDGMILTVAENGGGRAIDAPFVNRGRVLLEYPLALGGFGTRHSNLGRIELGGQILTVAGGSLLNAAGARLQGSGGVTLTVGTFTNAGVLAPGASPGRISVSGNMVQLDSGGIDIEVASAAGAGIGHDALVINPGILTLQGGALVTRLLGDFAPTAETRFRVVSASGGITGRFTKTPSLQVSANRYFQLEYLPTALDLRTLAGVDSSLPPSIVVHPTSQTVAEAGSASFTVGVNGTGPFTYQWRKNGVPIAGATGITLSLARLGASDFAVYDVVVSNARGSSTSDPATLAKSTGEGPGKGRDYGDAKDPLYPTTLAHNGASQMVNPGFTLGTAIDADSGTQQNADATADGADEDGVVFLDPLIPGQQYRIQVTHNADPGRATGRLSAWIDWGQDGSWAEAGERVINHRALNRGINLFTNAVPPAVPIGFTSSRFRLYPDNYPGYDGEKEEDGEVEDYRVEVVTGEGGGGPGGGEATRDFGDAPASYQTLLADDGPRHLLDASLHLGAAIDLEFDGQTNVLANGDDISQVPDDEDGVTGVPIFVPGLDAILNITVVGTGKVDAWVDFGRDGFFSQAGDRVLIGESFATETKVVRIPVPATAAAGATYARFRLTRNGINSWAGPAPNGEVEDYALLILPAGKDWGDAPETYPTLSIDSGAFHTRIPDFHLGKSIDAEGDGQPNSNATGDDIAPKGAVDDEDGVNFVSNLVPGQQAMVEVEASQAGVLDAWIDFDQDDNWSQASDRILTGRALVAGVNSITFSVPSSAKNGATFARFRLSRGGVATFTGDGGEGEVEDHRVVVDSNAGCELGCNGRDFWFTFPGNLAPDPANPFNPRLRFTGANGTTVTVSIPGLGFTLVTNVVGGGATVALPAGVDLGALNDGVLARGIHVTATGDIAVHALSQVRFTSDGFRALPTEVLTGEYVVGAWPNTQVGIPEISGSQFAVVATRPLTTVVITPSYETGTRLAGIPYSIVLTNVGDCYQLRNTNDAPADLTGTIIEAEFPVATFGGHVCANVNSSDLFYCDYLVEQMLPTERLASEFFTAPLATRSEGDTLRIVAAKRNTQVEVNDLSVILTNRGDRLELVLSEPSHIVANKPVQVYQFASSSDFDGVTNADPFMVTIPGLAHFTSQHRFATGGTNFASHYVNAIVPSSVTSFTLNGTVINPLFTGIGTTGYKYARLNPAQGVHTLTASADFGAFVYGWNPYESYAWPSCFFFGDTTAPRLTTTTNRVSIDLDAGADDFPCRTRVPDLRSLVTVRDNCGLPLDVIVTQDPPLGTLLGVGEHEITLSTEDVRGNTGYATITLTVRDTSGSSAISLTCPRDMTVRCESAETGAVVTYEVEALRGCTPIAVECSHPSGTRFPVGTTTVTCRITEPGVPVQVCSFKVTVDCSRARTVRITPPTRPTVPPGAPEPPSEITVEWDAESDAVLESADDATGPWTTVPTSGTRHTIKILKESGKFFRVRAVR